MTNKQKLVAIKLSENGGNIGRAMIDAGYSPTTAKTPQKLTQSKGWQELVNDIFPDELLLKKHVQLLNSRDYKTRLSALLLAYKIKGYLNPNQNENVSKSLVFEQYNISDEYLKRITKRD